MYRKLSVPSPIQIRENIPRLISICAYLCFTQTKYIESVKNKREGKVHSDTIPTRTVTCISPQSLRAQQLCYVRFYYSSIHNRPSNNQHIFVAFVSCQYSNVYCFTQYYFHYHKTLTALFTFARGVYL